MKIDRSFPYPVLGVMDDVEGDFGVNSTVQINDETTIIKISFSIDNEYIKLLVTEGYAKFILELRCGYTMYRDFFHVEKIGETETVSVSTKELNKNVEVFYYLTAAKDFEYKTPSFHKDYDGHTFNIKRGDIIGYKGQGYFFVDKYDPTLKNSGSILSVGINKEDNRVKYYFNDEKIVVLLPQKDFEIWIKNGVAFSEIYLSILAYPAMTEAVIKLAKEKEDFSSFKWAQAILKKAEYDEEIGSKITEQITSDDAIEVAQKILELPVSKSCYALENLENNFGQIEND